MNSTDNVLNAEQNDGWAAALHSIRDNHHFDFNNAATKWEAIFGPLRAGLVDDLIVVGQIGQSLDGRAATSTGHSHFINGADGLDHLHRLRALVDAVVVGVGTVLADDPQLTVRRVVGPQPARVIIDPRGRTPATARALHADGVRRLVILAEGTEAAVPRGVERIGLATTGGHIDAAAILESLAARGLRRILIEGGPATVARFIQARCLDRLHIMVAPMILGGGRASLDLGPIARCEQALRPQARVHVLGGEVLFDCDLSAQRRSIGTAMKSM